MGIQIVHHQNDAVLVRVVQVHQLLHHPSPVGFGAPVRHLHSAPSLQGRKQHEQVAHSVAFVIVRHGSPGLRREGLEGLLHQLFAGLVQGHQHLVVPELTVVDLQHVLHGADELGVARWRDAPALFQPRLEFVFFSVRRTVSVLMLSTISHSTSRSASSCSVQEARPSAVGSRPRQLTGLHQGRPTSWDSTWTLDDFCCDVS